MPTEPQHIDPAEAPSPSPPRTRHSTRRQPTRFEKEAAATGGKVAADHPGDPKVIGPWRIGRTIGKGASGRVKIARHTRSGKYAAVKIVPKNALTMVSRMSIAEAGAKQEKAVLGIEREIVIMKLIDHPNVMSLYDVWETSKELYLVLEYVEGGELFDYLVSQGRLPPDEASRYFQQIIAGVDYCHRFNICHRDLKPENLLLDAERSIKIADFGMAALEASDKLLETSCGSPHYASPEIVAGMSYHGAASDIWSCGVILFALLTGRLPFDDENIRVLLQKVKNGRFSMPADLPNDAKDLLSRMLVVDPEKRMSMSDIHKHPFCQRTQNTDSGRRLAIVEPPKMEDIARPVKHENEIDRDILRNLRTLWKGSSEREIISALMSREKSWEKAFYFLLLQYRNKHLENFNPDPDHHHGRRSRKDTSQKHPSKKTTSSGTNPEVRRERSSHSDAVQQKVATRPAPTPQGLNTPGKVSGPRSPNITERRPASKAGVARDISAEAKKDAPRGVTAVQSLAAPRTPQLLAQTQDKPKQVPVTVTPLDTKLPKITLQRPTPYDATNPPGTPAGLGLSINMTTPASPTPTGTATAPVSNAASPLASGTPSPSPGSPTFTINPAMGRVAVPQVQDAALQKFFHDIAEQLQLIGSASPRSSIAMDSPPMVSQFDESGGSGPAGRRATAPNIVLPSPGAAGAARGPRPIPSRSKTDEPPSSTVAVREAPVKRRSYLGDASARDNANGNGNTVNHRHSAQEVPGEKVKKPLALPLPTSMKADSRRKSRPPPLKLDSPQHKATEFLSPQNSPYLGTPPLGTSAPPSPLLVGAGNEVKGSWFSNLFSWKPASFTLISADDCASSRAECIKLLESFGASVILEDADGWGILKCRVEEIRDVTGIMIFKSVKFRIEFVPHANWTPASSSSPRPDTLTHSTNSPRPSRTSSPNPSTMPGNSSSISSTGGRGKGALTTSMTMVQEKGALSAFKAVYGRIRAEWRLDSLKSPALGSGFKFTSPMASPALSTVSAEGRPADWA